MQVEWDLGKARLNARKHGVALADAVAVLDNETALTMRDPFPEDEERWVTLGLDGFGRVLVVVYTWRGERLRLIPARKATPHEMRRYEESNETRIRFLKSEAWTRDPRSEGEDQDYDPPG